MTPREGFKFAFYYRCAEEGLTMEQARERARRGIKLAALRKQANPAAAAWGGLKALGGLGMTGAKTLGGLGLLGAVAAPAVVGGGIGLGLANAQEHDVDPEEIRQQELAAAYRFHAEQARRRMAMRNLRAGGPPR